MPMDVDIIAGKQSLDRIYLLMGRISHGEREAIADDIIEMEKKLTEKYKEEVEEKIKK
jgi:hypothetical protein